MIDWEKIRAEWEHGDMTFPELAEKHGVKLPTLKSRKKRDGWTREDPGGSDASASASKGASASEKMLANVLDKSDPTLTEKQRLFCIHYIKSFNATQAAKQAGYAFNSAHVTGSELLKLPKVAAEIRRLKGEVQKSLMVDAQDVLDRYIKIAFADITDYVEFGSREVPELDSKGKQVVDRRTGKPVTRILSYVDFKNHREIDGTILTEVKQGRDGISVKLADSMKAMEFLRGYFDLDKKAAETELKLQQMQLEIDRARIELGTISGDDAEDAHDQIDKYVKALDGYAAELYGGEADGKDDEA